MIGAILGDIIGSPYEFDRGNKSKDFPLFVERSTYTDDTVMTLAVGRLFSMHSRMLRMIGYCAALQIICVSLERCIPMPDTAECSASGSVIRNAGLIIVLAMALRCAYLRWRGYITILIPSDMRQDFPQKSPIIIRKVSRGLRLLPVLFSWQGQDTAKWRSRNISNRNLVMI